ncbi:L-methionine/branched-chain amino acid transporter [uncultured Thiothrix sp.]|uniref:L-methionine/branched-chain amino acid transporter n=1 Tax=uncultured Thiothrix sp. TaxID=223185 RepID=UPI0026043B4B|nr:L-methionine/branched-chain amino acid transporter [uncultured Thiothrix sp.]
MTSLNPTITRWQGIGLVTTTLLGTGVFILPQLTLTLAGSWATWAWLLLTLAILPLALVFAELGKHFPSAAGPAFFVQQAFGKTSGQLIGLLFLCIVPVGAPAALMITFEFLKPLITLTPLQALLGQLLAFALLFVLNWRGMQLSGRMQLGLTLAIVAVLVSLVFAFIWQTPSPKTELPKGTGSGVLQAMSLALWSFVGVEAVTHLSAEFKQPKKDFVPAVLGGTVLVGCIYVSCTLISALDAEAPLAMVGAYTNLLHSESGSWVIGLLGVASGLATVNVYMASFARLAWSLSQDGILPKALQPLNEHRVPSMALAIVLVVASLGLILTYRLGENFEVLILWANGVFILVYTASMLAAWRLVEPKFRAAILLALVVCAGFAWSLGAALLYAAGFAALLGAWILFNTKIKLSTSS